MHATFGEDVDYTLIVKKNLSDRASSEIEQQVKDEYTILMGEINKVDLAHREFKASQLLVNGQLQTEIDNVETQHAADIQTLTNNIESMRTTMNNALDLKLDKTTFESNKTLTDNAIAKLDADKINTSDIEFLGASDVSKLWNDTN